jgi:hypothetical protein
MAHQAAKEHKNWVVTFGIAMALFLALYLSTLWFGHSLVGEHEAGHPQGTTSSAPH